MELDYSTESNSALTISTIGSFSFASHPPSAVFQINSVCIVVSLVVSSLPENSTGLFRPTWVPQILISSWWQASMSWFSVLPLVAVITLLFPLHTAGKGG